MTTTTLRGVRSGLALLAGVAGLLFGATPARAQDVCGDLEDIAAETLDLYLDELSDEFDTGLNDDALCTKLMDNFSKACQTAAKDAVKCIQNQIKALNKQNETACKALEGPGADSCVAFYKNQSKASSEEVKAEGDDQAALCGGEAAEAFWFTCMFGDV